MDPEPVIPCPPAIVAAGAPAMRLYADLAALFAPNVPERWLARLVLQALFLPLPDDLADPPDDG